MALTLYAKQVRCPNCKYEGRAQVMHNVVPVRMLGLLLFLCAAGALSGQGTAGETRTVKVDGHAITAATHVIVLSDEPTPSQSTAASELREHLQLVTGEALSIIAEADFDAKRQTPLLIGRCQYTAEIAPDIDFGALGLEGLRPDRRHDPAAPAPLEDSHSRPGRAMVRSLLRILRALRRRSASPPPRPRLSVRPPVPSPVPGLAPP